MATRNYMFYIEWDGFDEKGNAEPQRVVWVGLTERQAVHMHKRTEDNLSHVRTGVTVKRFGWEET